MSKITKIQENIDTLILTARDLENQLGELELKRRLAILERDSTAKEVNREKHIEVSFELLQVKDKIRELGQKRRELENNAISESKKREVKELQATRDEVFKRFTPAFKRIEKLRSSLSI